MALILRAILRMGVKRPSALCHGSVRRRKAIVATRHLGFFGSRFLPDGLSPPSVVGRRVGRVVGGPVGLDVGAGVEVVVTPVGAVDGAAPSRRLAISASCFADSALPTMVANFCGSASRMPST